MGKAGKIGKNINTTNVDAAKEISKYPNVDGDVPQNNIQNTQNVKVRADLLKEKILKKYEGKEGTQLYLRFPHKIPETEEGLQEKVKQLSSLILRAHKPRQNYARFCLIDFNNKKDRDAALKDFRKRIKSGELSRYVVKKPRTENKEFIQELIERKIRNHEKRRLKMKLKQAKKRVTKEANFTTSITLTNLPLATTTAEIYELFPNAVDVQVKLPNGKTAQTLIAAVIFPTTFEANSAMHRHLSLHGKPIHIYFNTQRKKFINT